MNDKETPSQLVYSLWHAGRTSFEKAEKLNRQLATTTAVFHDAVRQLPGATSAQVKSSLGEIAQEAAQAIASEWTEANEHAEKAAEIYRKAIVDARKQVFAWAGILFGALALVVLVLGFWILPSWSEMSAIRAETVRLTQSLNLLTKQGARANVLPCTDLEGHNRMCVLIDESARVSKGLRVIKGY